MIDSIVFSDPKEIPNEDPDEVIEYGTFEELIRAACLRGGDLDVKLKKILPKYADVEIPALERDVTGTLICPGVPKMCLGSDYYPMFPLCCDNCDYFLKCFPEAMPGEA